MDKLVRKECNYGPTILTKCKKQLNLTIVTKEGQKDVEDSQLERYHVTQTITRL